MIKGYFRNRVDTSSKIFLPKGKDCTWFLLFFFFHCYNWKVIQHPQPLKNVINMDYNRSYVNRLCMINVHRTFLNAMADSFTEGVIFALKSHFWKKTIIQLNNLYKNYFILLNLTGCSQKYGSHPLSLEPRYAHDNNC